MTGPASIPSTHPLSVGQAGIYQRLRAHLAYLKMPDAAAALPEVLDQARDQQLGLTAALERLPCIEVAAVEARRQTGRLRFACLPQPWQLSDFDFTAQPGVNEALIQDLATLRFLDDATNGLIIGLPGVGKTMLAICLARAAVDAGHRVYFTFARRTWPPTATKPPVRDVGTPACGSSPARHSWSSTSWATSTSPTKPSQPCSRSSPNAT